MLTIGTQPYSPPPPTLFFLLQLLLLSIIATYRVGFGTGEQLVTDEVPFVKGKKPKSFLLTVSHKKPHESLRIRFYSCAQKIYQAKFLLFSIAVFKVTLSLCFSHSISTCCTDSFTPHCSHFPSICFPILYNDPFNPVCPIHNCVSVVSSFRLYFCCWISSCLFKEYLMGSMAPQLCPQVRLTRRFTTQQELKALRQSADGNIESCVFFQAYKPIFIVLFFLLYNYVALKSIVLAIWIAPMLSSLKGS